MGFFDVVWPRIAALAAATLVLTACGDSGSSAARKSAETSTTLQSHNLESDSMNTATLPFGSWPSPISAESLVEGARGIGSLSKDGDFFYWLESRPQEGGRNTIMRWRPGQSPEEVLAQPFNVRTRVQEYGGSALLVSGGRIWFSNFADQRVYLFEPDAKQASEPRPITPDAPLRFAGCALDEGRNRLLCIREDHRAPGEPSNALVALATDAVSEGDVLFSGTDFVSQPRLSSDGAKITFVSWMHPNMPWDNTALHSATFAEDGSLENLRQHNPGKSEAVLDPQWSPDGALIALSDRDNWWQPYRVDGETFTPLGATLLGHEVGGPAWSIGGRYVYPMPSGDVLFIAARGSVESLYLLRTTGELKRIDIDAVSFGSIVAESDRMYLTVGFADRPSALIAADYDGNILEVVRRSKDTALAAQWVPTFEQRVFPLEGGGETYGIFYPPQNPHAQAPEGTAPPLIVAVHGGPTGAAGVSYNPGHYYWTSRGFAVLDLNYRGSTGFGREYRRALYGQWGIADVEDAVAAVKSLVEDGLADPDRLIIRGGSAGGYTTLAAHAFYDTFAAGASYYGVSDIEALARDTHKFESRYLDQLIGPYPERRDLYQERSPINHLEGFGAPLILLQGLEDPIVPPNQSEMIFSALKGRGVPTAYVAFEGESHGFRKAENIISSREAELYFYAQVLGLSPADDLAPIAIENLNSAPAP